jgi:eukaryotic-like serine/threonine-protein kinase
MTLSPGNRLGPYEILSSLGSGGMGEVYRARDTRLGREVAIKILPENVAGDSERLARFEREARSASALSHANVVAVYDVGREGETFYFVTELVEGGDLRDLLDRGPVSLKRALELSAQIASGLAAAHDEGIVHRDLKPENILITRSGQAKIADFGLARLGEAREGDESQMVTADASRTAAGAVMGTVAYMSPEQARGERVAFRSDQFSFGIILMELVVGTNFFRRPTAPETLVAILTEEPPPVAIAGKPVPSALERILSRCLEKNAEARYGSTRDLARDLADLRDHLSEISRNSVSVVAPGRAPLRVVARFWWPAAALVTLLGAGLGWWLRGSSAGSRQRGPVEIAFEHLTEEPGVESDPSLSPDGKSVVFVSSSRGNEDIFLLRVGGRNPDDLTADSPAADYAPAFSPDGESIAFRSERAGGGIFVMGATGESVRRVTDFGFDPAWSPDGKEIVVDTEPVRDPMSRASLSSLWAVPSMGGAKRLVAKGDAVGPRWSPHGRRIAFWGLHWPGSQRDIWTVAADGSQADAPVPVTDDPALDWSPEWSPDGRYLYFASNRGGTMNLWRVPIDESSGRTLGKPEPVTVPAAWIGGLSFSRDGRKLAMADLSQGSDIWKVGFDPEREELVGQATRILHGQGIFSVDCSADGESIVFSRRGVPWESLGTVRADGTAYTQLTDYVTQHRFARWSPDGQRIAFASFAGGTQQIWSLRPDGSGLERLSHSNGAFNPAWSPDGKRLAFGDLADELVLIDPSRPSQPPTRIPDPGRPGELLPISWSPDGKQLAVDWQRPDRSTGILICSLGTRTFREVEKEGRWPMWLPDGRRLLYQSKGGLAVLDLASGHKHWILPDGTLRAGSSWQNFCLSRDGRRLIYLESFGEGDIWLMTLGETAPPSK